MIGSVWELKCVPRYYVRVDGATPSGKTLRVVECNAKGRRKRAGRKVLCVRATTFLNLYKPHSDGTD